MPIRATIAVSIATLCALLAFASSAPAASPDPARPLTCEGRCSRQVDNCMKAARNERDRADCQFERHACFARCDRKGDAPASR